MKILLMSLVLFISSTLYSQDGRRLSLKQFLEQTFKLKNKRYILIDSPEQNIYLLVYGNCNFEFSEALERKKVPHINSTDVSSSKKKSESIRKSKLVQIEGTVSYEYYFNDRVDTPFNVNGYKQHTETVQLKLLLKEKYPLNISFSARQSNNPAFKNYFNPSIYFDRPQFNRRQIDNYSRKFLESSGYALALQDLKRKITSLEEKQIRIQQETSENKWPQKIVNEREEYLRYKANGQYVTRDAISRDLFNEDQRLELENKVKNAFRPTKEFTKTPTPVVSIPAWLTSLNMDSLKGLPKTPTESLLEARTTELLKVQNEHSKIARLKDSIQTLQANELKSLRESIADSRKWKEHLKKYGGVNRRDMALSNIKSFGIGRTSVNFSELTIKNIFISGIQVEYDPRKYYAVAAGKVDYRFRDFYNVSRLPNQYYAIVRYGSSYRNRSGIIGSFFYGQKATYGIASRIDNFSGYSVESFYNWDDDNRIHFEIAKTTPASKGVGKSGLFSFSNDNLALSAKVNLKYKKTLSSFEGFYRKIGHSFQSIHLFTGQVNQTAWHLKAQQELFKKSLRITMMLRQNDFSNEGQTQNFSSTAILKSIQISYRKNKMPFLTFGYYPGTQFVKTDSGIIENLYYLVNLTSGYSVRTGIGHSYTVFNYNKFISQSTDSGFIKFNGYTILLNESFSLEKMTMQLSAGYTNQQSIKYHSVEGGIDYNWRSFLSFGAGIKCNKTSDGKVYYGGRANLNITFVKAGALQLFYDRMFIPEANNKLTGTDIGRVGWTKNF